MYLHVDSRTMGDLPLQLSTLVLRQGLPLCLDLTHLSETDWPTSPWDNR